MPISKELQIGKAGEYLVCADLILKGFVAFPSEQGLPYDVVFDYHGKLLKIQVKTTQSTRDVPQRQIPVKAYIFNVSRRGRGNKERTSAETCDIFALVALDSKMIGYLPNQDVRQTMNFRCEKFRGTYRVENNGQYLEDLTLERCLCLLK